MYELQTAEVCCRSECLKMECHLGKMFHRLEVRAGTNNIVCEVEEKFEISSMVQKTLDRIVRKIKAFSNVRWCVQWGEWTHLILEKKRSMITFSHWQTNHCTNVTHYQRS